MSLLYYLFYFLAVILLDVCGLKAGFHISLLYILVALALLILNTVRRWIARRNGTMFRDSKKAEMLDNSVTKPASFKHEFLYNDCSNKTLFFIELPFVLCTVVNLVLQWIGLN